MLFYYANIQQNDNTFMLKNTFRKFFKINNSLFFVNYGVILLQKCSKYIFCAFVKYLDNNIFLLWHDF